eukprot:COSAG01_NODE_2796_length_7058_cov_12.294295_11_plen_89_part_00
MTTPRVVVQPHIAWFKDQKDYRSKKAPQGTLALRQGNAMVQKGVDATLLPVSRLFFFFFSRPLSPLTPRQSVVEYRAADRPNLCRCCR